MHKVLVNRLGGLSLTRKSVVRLGVTVPTWPQMFTVDVIQQNSSNKKKQELLGEDVVVEEAYVCVAWWKGAAVTFGNSALFKDCYIVYD